MSNFILTDRQYGEGFQVSELKGRVSLISARESNEGKVWQRWGEIEVGKNKTAKLPVSVTLGSPTQAVEVLEKAIAIIKKMNGAAESAPVDEGEEVPF